MYTSYINRSNTKPFLFSETNILNFINLYVICLLIISIFYVLADTFENTDVIVASEKEIIVSAVREGFQKVFGKSIVR